MKVMASGAKVVAAGFGHSMVLTQEGSVWATGANLFGQLGDGSTSGKGTFVAILAPRVGACCTVLSMLRIGNVLFPEILDISSNLWY